MPCSPLRREVGGYTGSTRRLTVMFAVSVTGGESLRCAVIAFGAGSSTGTSMSGMVSSMGGVSTWGVSSSGFTTLTGSLCWSGGESMITASIGFANSGSFTMPRLPATK